MTAPLSGQVIRTSDAFNLVTFTPTYTGVTVGSGGSNEGWYQTIGNFVLWGFRVQFGTSPSISTTAQITMPVAGYTGGGTALQGTLGAWTMRDNSAAAASQHWSGSIGWFSAGGLQASFAGGWSGTSPSQRVTSGVPFTVAIDDVFSGSGCYRAA